MNDDDEYPQGVKLREFDDYDSLRTDIFDGMKAEMSRVFPQSYGGIRVELNDVDYDGPDRFTLKDQKHALLNDKFLARRLRGTMRLVDEKTGSVMDEKKMTLMQVPYLTERGTFVHNGSEYTTNTQARLMPGVYTRRQANGELETQFNPKVGSGSSFRVGFDPKSTQYRMKIGQANLHLYSLLRDLGVNDEQLREAWGDDIWERNQRKYDSRVFDKAYARLVPKRNQKPEAAREDKTLQLKEALDHFLVAKKVIERTLPNMLDFSKSAAWRARWAGKKAAMELWDQYLEKMDFEPDFEPLDLVKIASETEAMRDSDDFMPDLDADQMQEAYDAVYGKSRPQLASMQEWPEEWINKEADELGWIEWYLNYAAGRRTDDDARQIKRWKSMKARHGAQLVKNPTPRRAFALRYWAIDPLKLIKDDAARTKLEQDMETYRTDKEQQFADKKASFVTKELVTDMGPFDYYGEGWSREDEYSDE